MRRLLAVVATLLVVTAGVAPATATSASTNVQEASAFSGAHVEFTTESDAIVDYRVDGTTFFESVRTQSKTAAESDGLLGVGGDVSAITSLSGSALTLQSQSKVSATVTAESGATIATHDNENGIMVVRSGGDEQYVQFNVSNASEATYQGEGQVLVTTEEDQTASLFVVGEGSVGVNDDGNVVASVGGDGEDGFLVVRTYEGDRGTDDQNQEALIADGVAAGEVYVMQRGGETVADTVRYDESTTIEATTQGDRVVKLSVDRATEEGTILLTSVSKEAVAGDALTVTVDGETAAEATTYDELRLAADGGQESKYMVQTSSNAKATSKVAIAVNHFSERMVAIESAASAENTTPTGGESQGEETTSGDSGEATEASETGESTDESTTSSPGFGPLASLVALLVAAVAFSRRRD